MTPERLAELRALSDGAWVRGKRLAEAIDAVESLQAQLDEERKHGKYYVKARVYGAIAAEYRKVIQAHADRGDALAQAALAWRHSVTGGVPMSSVDAIGELLDAARERDEARAQLFNTAKLMQHYSDESQRLLAQVVEVKGERDALQAQVNAYRLAETGGADYATTMGRLQAELDASRKSCSEMHRRAQEAEAGIAIKAAFEHRGLEIQDLQAAIRDLVSQRDDLRTKLAACVDALDSVAMFMNERGEDFIREVVGRR